MSRRDIAPRVFLARLPLFRELGAASIERIAAGSSKQRLARGATLFRQGEATTGFYLGQRPNLSRHHGAGSQTAAAK